MVSCSFAQKLTINVEDSFARKKNYAITMMLVCDDNRTILFCHAGTFTYNKKWARSYSLCYIVRFFWLMTKEWTLISSWLEMWKILFVAKNICLLTVHSLSLRPSFLHTKSQLLFCRTTESTIIVLQVYVFVSSSELAFSKEDLSRSRSSVS